MLPAQNDRLPNIVPLEFWVDYKPQADGSQKEEERVKWIRRGAIGAETSEAVHRLQRDSGLIWQALKPYYDHWKQGKDTPINGTPLAAWPGATPQLVKALEPYHIRSVEDLAKIEDSTMNRLGVPGIRVLKSNALAFLEAQQNTAAVAGEVAQLRELALSQANEIDELKAMVNRLTPEEKRGPGRPRKEQAA
jgi:hypothetical protein